MSAVHRSPSGPPSLPVKAARRASRRSEEHTSELQSQSNLVCRLLLEKKKSRRECSHDRGGPSVLCCARVYHNEERCASGNTSSLTIARRDPAPCELPASSG